MRFGMAKTKTDLYYFDGENLGDRLNATLIKDLFHIEVSLTPFSTAELISIGSVLDRLVRGSGAKGKYIQEQQAKADTKTRIDVWGTGLMYEYTDCSALSFLRPVKIHAVRGDLTRQTVERITGKPLKCALGDPAVLTPYMSDPVRSKKHTLGIIPHVAEYGMPEYKRIRESVEGSVIIDLTKDPKKVMCRIASCECVISTSLHGLIVADAFGVPSKWCQMTNKILGNGFKYRDYYSGFGLTAEAYDLSGGAFPSPEEIKADYQIRPDAVRQMQLALVKSFPYQNQYTRDLIRTIKKQK